LDLGSGGLDPSTLYIVIPRARGSVLDKSGVDRSPGLIAEMPQNVMTAGWLSRPDPETPNMVKYAINPGEIDHFGGVPNRSIWPELHDFDS